jgi:hypothetical protein
MAEQGVIATKTGNVLQALKNTGMSGRQLIRHAQGALSPFVQLEMGGSQAEPVGRVGIDVKRSHRQLVAIEDPQQATKQPRMIDGKAGL